jgi:hypothetical protein
VKQLSQSLQPLAAEELSGDESIEKGDHGLIAGGHLSESLAKIDKKSPLPSHRNLKKTVGNLQKTCHTAGE